MAKHARLAGRPRQRDGATVVEMAIILPVFVLLLIGLCVAGLGVFRYHQIAALAHESARWASVHGREYSKRTGKPVATSDGIYQNVIKNRAVALDMNKVSYDVKWDANLASVAVTVRYQWTPEAFFAPLTFSSTAQVLATY